MKDKYHMISTDSGKTFDRIKYTFLIKVLKKTGVLSPASFPRVQEVEAGEL
jgi:hypothetical protein